jgi:para-nitrobenzyl esterase
MTDPIVVTKAGSIRGRTVDGIDTFTGVRYAEPPVGELRFAAPVAAASWEGVRDAREAGPTPPQSVPAFAAIDIEPIVGAGWTKGDDYLTLNVWTPSDHGTKRPVMVWIYGGGFTIGNKDATVYDGSAFARDGAVVVAMNYRLGIEGFVPIDGAATNLGIRDILLALAWVRDNAAVFGGDPDNVTIFGESAGGILVACLLSSPLAVGLFRRAIVQSGHGSVPAIDIGRRIATAAAKRLGVENTRAGFLEVSAEQLVKVLGRLALPGAVNLRDDDGINKTYGLTNVVPSWGDDVLPQEPLAAVRAGYARDVDLLVCTTEQEVNFWFAPTPLRFMPRPLGRLWLGGLLPKASAILGRYHRQFPSLRAGMLVAAVLSDFAFRWPARELAAAHQGNTWVAEFDWRSPAANGRLGAAHGLDLAFVFDSLAVVTGPKGFAGMNPPQALATRVHDVWVAFAKDGTAPWAQFDGQTRQVYRLSADRVEHETPLPAADFALH